jgi:DNA-binding CsgD family transcriptional regulator
VSDPDLRDALARAINERPELKAAEADDASVVVCDGPSPDVTDFGARTKVLRIGGSAGWDETVVASAEPGVILGAALLLARGYRVEPASRAGREGDHPHLSARERQVTALLIEGASNKEIARRLDISVHTAKFHVTAVMEKLGARNRADAVGIALREGMVVL